MKRQEIRILIADDHSFIRLGIIRTLNSYEHITVAGEACTGKELIDKYFRLEPDLCLVDISMPDMSGIEAVTEICRKDRTVKSLFYSGFCCEDFLQAIISAGGNGFVSKTAGECELISAINAVTEGDYYFDGKLVSRKSCRLESGRIFRKSESRTPGTAKLTMRENEIMNLYGMGYDTNIIADKLFISKSSVDFHRSNMMCKLGVDSFTKFMSIAVQYVIKSKYNIPFSI